MNTAVLEVLQIRRVVEEMKASNASSRAATKVIRLTWVNAILTLLIVVVTACGVGWDIFCGSRQARGINGATSVIDPAPQHVPDPDG